MCGHSAVRCIVVVTQLSKFDQNYLFFCTVSPYNAQYRDVDIL